MGIGVVLGTNSPVPSLLVAPTNASGSGSTFATTNKDRLLAEMIPALSQATGRNSLGKLDAYGDRNFDMINMKNGFPPERFDNTRTTDKYPWLHGDYRAVAYVYVYKVFDKICVEIGELNQ